MRQRPPQPLAGNAVAVEHDLREPRDPALPEAPRTIVHLAQSPHHHDFPKGALDVFEVNVGSTQRLLDWGVRHGVKRFIFASSGGVYGYGAAPFDETAPVQGAANHYIAGKRCGELLAEAYRGQMTVIILRFFFVYGPGQRARMLVPRLVKSVTEGLPIALAGQCGLRLNPIFADDAASAVQAALRLTESTVVNVAGGEVLSLRDMADLIGREVGRSPVFQHTDGPEGLDLVADITRMRTLLHEPAIGFQEGIRRLIQVSAI